MSDRADEALWRENMDRGVAAFENRRYARAEEFFGAALAEAEKFPPDDLRRAKTFNNMAALCHAQGKYAMAEDFYNRALAINQRVHGCESAEVAVNLHNLAVLCSATGRYADAERFYRQAIDLREKLNGAEAPALVDVLRNYGLLLKRAGREGEADEVERRIEAIGSGAAGPAST